MSTQIREVGTDGITRKVPTPASQPGDVFPAGTILMWPTATPPSGWLICNGTLVARATYPSLSAAFAVDGYIWGAGDGSSTMALPNFVDNSPIGAGNLYALAAAVGEATHVLTQAEMPVHNHSASMSGSGSGSTDSQGNHNHSIADAYVLNGNGSQVGQNDFAGAGAGMLYRSPSVGLVNAAGIHAHNVSVSVSVSGATNNTGSGAAHNNVHPCKGIHYIIRAY